ncbi:hypothetical protein STAS_34274 [Striga asiatica]|uniref:Uncharacterized protein n=1 Tax=Striga asiatica TaxID=4170 RepID=A0A5A7RH87_STRAF|nr:hypothetical protein STAS_34274 [Striga asiatica]
MDPIKSGGRGRILMCFKPTFDYDDEHNGGDLADSPTSSRRRKTRTRKSFKTFLLKKFRGDQHTNKDFDRLSSGSSSKSKKFVRLLKTVEKIYREREEENEKRCVH